MNKNIKHVKMATRMMIKHARRRSVQCNNVIIATRRIERILLLLLLLLKTGGSPQ